MDPSATEASDQSPPISHLVAKYPLDVPLVALDGADLQLLFYAAYEWLAAHFELVNRLNVFPVKDGDTGTNLLLTMKAAWAAAVAQSGQSAGRVLQAAAEGALHGSRGNSGVIFSQFLRGVSQNLVDHERLMTGNLAKALPRGAEVAFQSVPSPVEGTILTVMREVGQAAVRMAASTLDLRTFFAELVVVADEAVRRTPDQLAVLKQAGVVDSGGKGLFFILEGMYRALMGVTAPSAELLNLADAPVQPLVRKGQRRLPKVQWGFDVQCLIECPTQPLAVIRQTITAMGDYPLVEGDERLVKVHVHVFDPGAPLSYAVQIGFVTDVVVENLDDMAATYDGNQAVALAVASPEQSEVALVDKIGLVAVTPGAGFADIFREIGVDAVVAGGETMNPSTAELLAGVESLPNQRILILPNNSNVLLAAQQAAKLAQPPRQVLVVPTKTLPEGIAAALAVTPNGDDLAKTAAHLQERIAEIDTGEVAQAVRHAEFDGVTVEVGDYIGLHNGRLVTSAHTPEAVALALLEQMAADESDLITFYYGAQIAVEAAENLKEMVCNRYPDQDVELAFGGQENYHYILSTE